MGVAQKKLLRVGKLDEVTAEIEKALEGTAVTGPGNKYRREVLGNVRDHFVARMQIAKLRRADLESVAASWRGPSAPRRRPARWPWDAVGPGPGRGRPPPPVRVHQQPLGRLHQLPDHDGGDTS